MEELMVVANVAIVFGVIYKLFELYVRRQERIMLIEKLSSGAPKSSREICCLSSPLPVTGLCVEDA